MSYNLYFLINIECNKKRYKKNLFNLCFYIFLGMGLTLEIYSMKYDLLDKNAYSINGDNKVTLKADFYLFIPYNLGIIGI